jgi:hypothetical protein
MRKRVIRRIFFLTKKIGRQILRNYSSGKFLSGNGIAKFCDLHINSLNAFEDQDLKNCKTIFVNSDYFLPFLQNNLSFLSDKIIFVGNGDKNFDQEIGEMHVPKQLYLQNLGFIPSIGKIKVLPIGLENYEHFRSGFGFLHYSPKTHRVNEKVLVPPMSPTNEIRRRTLKDLMTTDQSVFQIETKFRSIIGYLKLTKRFKFILVCEGNGHDTHRLWEVLYQNSFPVLIDSNFARNIASLGLPVLIVGNVNEITTQMLQSHCEKFQADEVRNNSILWLNHWRNIAYDHE